MVKVRIYYVTCDSVTTKPSVVKVSTDYDEVVEWRDRLAALALDDKSVCQEAHPIRSHEVRLLA
jgi:hypothetical protein